MIRFSEMVLPGHPDKLCDQIADAIVMEAYKADQKAYCQVEVSCWCDEFFVTGGTATRRPMETPIEEIVRSVGRGIGYRGTNAVDASRWSVRSTVCQESRDPRQWTEHVNDQCIVIGYAGYDSKTHFLPPEHYIAHRFRESLTTSCSQGRLKGQGPDGKLLVRVKEEGLDWVLEHVLVTVQQLETSEFADIVGFVMADLQEAYSAVRSVDRRWVRDWEELDVLVNPNGPLVNGGPDGDNGQTGRKLVMDYYGPRVPIGGGALAGKDLSHIDRAAAYAARRAAVTAVGSGAKETLVRVAYAPNLSHPLDVSIEQIGGTKINKGQFDHRTIITAIKPELLTPNLARGEHFYKGDWNGMPPQSWTHIC
jgi:S-adenosylmethionine synthetase